MIGQFLDAGAPAAVDARCATDNPAPPFVIPEKKK
jgi:hypothetical protein